MQVIRARKMGFCFGVRRAFEKVQQLAGESDARPLYLAGELVHNTKVIDRIGQLGVTVVEEVDAIRDSRAVIRTHGTTRENFQHLMASNRDVHDATCVIVKDAREAALDLLTRHPVVIVSGKKKHPEVVGLVSWLDGRYHVVEDEADLAALPDYPSVGVVSQTTFYPEKFRKFCEAMRERYSEVEVKDTICPHTAKNQETSIYTAQIVDVMLVVGDPHSSNSRTLFAEVQQVNPRSYFISGADDVDPAWFVGLHPAAKPKPDATLREKGNAPADYDPAALAVGITAGASTPDWVIDEIEEKLRSL
jgi:(E)-4-hydroxy-3-methyl-but-2-enyl pyrophosphate reductase